MKRIFIGVILLMLILAAPAFSSSRVDLDHGWLFQVDSGRQGESSGWQKQLPADVKPVNIPHTWNVGPLSGYVGKAWYFRTFTVPSNSADLHAELHFGATFYSARVWLNGVEIGQHEGGYTAYSFDITPHLRASNYLAVEVDNTISASTIPGFAMRGDDNNYDWWNYGGIVRDVWLSVGGPLQVRRQQIRGQIDKGSASVEDRIHLNNNLQAPEKVTVVIRAFDPDSHPAGVETRAITIDPHSKDVSLLLRIDSPKLWSIDHPNVYRMVAQIKSGNGKVLDEQSDTFGLRTIEIRDRHLLVNGERVRLTGLTRHEESVSEGLAETPDIMRSDYDDMKALQVTLTRPVHYPQNPYILDYADRHGILMIPEIPVWQFSEAQLKDPKVIALAKQQIREMIEESGNHPSIFAWSVCNESATGTPGGIAFYRTMRNYIRTLDPDRFVSYADDNLPKLNRAEESAANDADFLMMNQYFGSWHGPETGLSAALDKINKMFPDKMMIVSEFGLPGIFADTPASADKMRSRIIEEQLPELAKRDWIAGAILWCYQDYKSRRNLSPGRTEGFVDHGVVDEFRQRKPSYYVWKDLNAPAQLDITWTSAANNSSTFSVKINPNPVTDLPSYPLRDYKLTWQVTGKKDKLIASGEQQLPDLTSPQTISRTVSSDGTTAGLKLHITLVRPVGTVAAEKIVDWTPVGNNTGKSNAATAAQVPGAK
jgi:hypothetical protein